MAHEYFEDGVHFGGLELVYGDVEVGLALVFGSGRVGFGRKGAFAAAAVDGVRSFGKSHRSFGAVFDAGRRPGSVCAA